MKDQLGKAFAKKRDKNEFLWLPRFLQFQICQYFIDKKAPLQQHYCNTVPASCNSKKAANSRSQKKKGEDDTSDQDSGHEPNWG